MTEKDRLAGLDSEQAASRNIKLVLEYNGTNYHGWQTQAGSGKATIQETLEKALTALTGEPGKATGSGRTDAGVHALGHVANFRTSSPIPPVAWAPALNHLLPEDIRVLSSQEVSKDFHSRYSAQGKIYQYRILNRPAQSALWRNHAWHLNVQLNLKHMRLAAESLLGRHDFSTFRSSSCSAKSPIRTIKALGIKKRGDFIDVFIEADAFLMHMARNLVGTLAEVGLGRFHPEEVKPMLEACDRTRAGRTAPAHGLYLVTVFYSG